VLLGASQQPAPPARKQCKQQVLVALQPPATNLAGAARKSMARVPVISTYRVLACCWVLPPSLLLMCMGNGPQVRQDLLPAARDFLLVTARAHPPSSSEAPFPPLQMISTTHHQPYRALLRSGRILAKHKPKCRSSGCRLGSGGAEKRTFAITLQNSSTESSHARTSNSNPLF
jgi:hypothetical protein